MEALYKRYPRLTEDILSYVDDQSLNNFKETSRKFLECLKNGKIIWIRLIEKYQIELKDFPKLWKPVVDKISSENLKKIWSQGIKLIVY